MACQIYYNCLIILYLLNSTGIQNGVRFQRWVVWIHRQVQHVFVQFCHIRKLCIICYNNDFELTKYSFLSDNILLRLYKLFVYTVWQKIKDVLFIWKKIKLQKEKNICNGDKIFNKDLFLFLLLQFLIIKFLCSLNNNGTRLCWD